MLVSQRTYCYNMRKDKTYGSSVEMLAMSEIYKININIFTQVALEVNGKVSINENPTIINKKSHIQNINLLLSGDSEKGHFELLIPAENITDNRMNTDVARNEPCRTQTGVNTVNRKIKPVKKFSPVSKNENTNKVQQKK